MQNNTPIISICSTRLSPLSLIVNYVFIIFTALNFFSDYCPELICIGIWINYFIRNQHALPESLLMPVFSSEKGIEATNCFQSISLGNCCFVLKTAAALGQQACNELLWLRFAVVSKAVQGHARGTPLGKVRVILCSCLCCTVLGTNTG